MAIRLTSTLFPHLPRAHAEPFRWSLIIASAGIVLPAGLGFYPIALIVAALAVPLVMVLYLYAVNVYEDEPVRIVAGSAAWGLMAGLAAGLLTRALEAPNPVAAPDSLASQLISLGLVVPVAGALLASVGPLALLRYRKFNDVLDGTTFGVVVGSWFVGAQALSTGAAALTAGLQPPGDLSSWIVRLLALGIVSIVLWAATFGSVMGVFWLRFRAPVRDRAELGLVGRPAIAGVLGLLLLVLASAGQLLLNQAVALGWLVVLAALAIMWLRRTIHLGLLQGSGNQEIGPPVRCGNCGQATPYHTFCAHCGIALRALPKARASDRPQSHMPELDAPRPEAAPDSGTPA